MRNHRVELFVGIFMLVSFTALVLLATKISGLNDIYTSDTGYKLTADFLNVGGLKPKARVTVAGVAVGRVLDIHFEQDQYVARVTLSIDEDVDRLPNDTQASILTSGLLGDNYIGLKPGFSEVYLKPNEHIMEENTHSAVILEELISKFVAGQASSQ